MMVHHITFMDGGSRALVELKPSWLARLFGASYVCVELNRNDLRMRASNGWDKCPWYSVQTDRPLHQIRNGWMIICALDAQPIDKRDPIPKAIVHSTMK